jgi:hypothetical protein
LKIFDGVTYLCSFCELLDFRIYFEGAFQANPESIAQDLNGTLLLAGEQE